jgi:peptidoglycan/xylan/chitin deacetylase (PgdA/CDA1 family)
MSQPAGEGHGLRVALTFDAEHPDRHHCPPGTVTEILDTLTNAEARATFFVQGRWATAYPEVAARIAADGHVVGSHSHYHAPMTALSDAGFRADVRLAGSTIRRVTGADPRPWFRCPFLAGEHDGRVLAALDDMGYRHIGHHVALRDWEPERTASELAAEAVGNVTEHGDGAVVLMHTWPATTPAAVRALLDGLGRAGARLVGIDELDELP